MRLKWWAMTFVATFPSGVTWFYVGFGVSELFLITTSVTWYAIWNPFRNFKEPSNGS